MEDKQIVELYLARFSEAIPKTEEKYGQYASYIAHHILQDKAEAVRCIKECYELLWETIPPHRPQNLKAYLCKITRNHALQMKYPAANPELDLFSAELVIYDFLKCLEAEQRKLFVARYWYMSLISEIAMQYKMSESKVEKEVLSLRQKLEEQLAEKNIHLQNEEDLLLAMTEIEDCYLAEAELKIEDSSETSQDIQDTKTLYLQIWRKYQIPIMSCVVCLLLLVFVWLQNPVEQNPLESGSEDGYFNSGTVEGGTEITDVILEGSEILKEEDFQNRINALPWNETMDITVMPVYKNLAYYSEMGETVYYSEASLLEMAETVAKKLDMQVLGFEYRLTDTGEPWMIEVDADKGIIQVQGNGNVFIQFTDGVQIPVAYQIISTENANQSVEYLLEYFQDVLLTDWVATSYPSYDYDGNVHMNYQAVGNGIYGIDNIVAHYFRQVDFYYDNDMGLAGISYSDICQVAEFVDYYPIISVEEAKLLLQEGKYIAEFFYISEGGYDESLIQGVELMYLCSPVEEYFQPYYRFYLKEEGADSYGSLYVPAIKGVNIDDMLLPEKDVTIIDMGQGSYGEKIVYYNEGQFYTVSELWKIAVETNTFASKLTYKETTHAIDFSWCEVNDELFAWLNTSDEDGIFSLEKISGCKDKVLLYKVIEMEGIEAVFLCDLSQKKISFLLDKETVGAERINSVYASKDTDAIIINTHWDTKPLLYNGTEIIDLSEVIGEEGDAITARFVEDKVLISNLIYGTGRSKISCYLYDIEDKSVACVVDNEEHYSDDSFHMYFYDGRYMTRTDVSGNIEIVDLVDGTCAQTDVQEAMVESGFDASAEHYAFVFTTGEVAVVEKESGQTVKKFEQQLNCTPNNILYKDDTLYVEDWCGRYFVFVLTY